MVYRARRNEMKRGETTRATVLKFLSGDAATSWSKYRAVLVAAVLTVAAVVVRGLRRERRSVGRPAGRHEILIRRDYMRDARIFFLSLSLLYRRAHARTRFRKEGHAARRRSVVGDLRNQRAVAARSLFFLASPP